MKFVEVKEKYPNEIYTGFKGDFFKHYMCDFSFLGSEYPVLTEEEKLNSLDEVIGVSYFLENDEMSKWQQGFEEYFKENYKLIESQVIRFFQQDTFFISKYCHDINNLVRVLSLKGVEIFYRGNQEILLSFSSVIHEHNQYLLDVLWRESGEIKFSEINFDED